jgi:hypothetical protein
METISEYFNEANQQLETTLQPRSKHYQQQRNQKHKYDDEFVNYGKYEGALNLSDIGLDDMSLNKVLIELSTDRSHFKIWAPFHQEFIEDLKSQIPSHSRRWDPNERCWRVDCYWFGNAQLLLPVYYPDLDRHYTDRAIRMCEQIARDEDKEERYNKKQQKKKKPNRQRSKRKRSNKKTKSRAREPEPTYPEDEAYKVLGVDPEAPDEVVKAAHKALARKYHPDLGGDEKRTKKINDAFETIKEMRGWITK